MTLHKNPHDQSITTEPHRDAVPVTLQEALSRFGQTQPVEIPELAGNAKGPHVAVIEGRIGPWVARVATYQLDSRQRYRVRVQNGWCFALFDAHDVYTVEINVGGEWVAMEFPNV